MRPAGVASIARTPTPRRRVGSHGVARPVTGSTAAMPLRDTAPLPAFSLPYGLFIHRWWPPTYTAGPVTETVYSESPPVWFTQAGCCPAAPAVGNRATVSHMRFGPEARPVVTTANQEPSGAKSTPRM